MSGASNSNKSSLAASLVELPHLPRNALVELWIKHIGQPPPKAASTPLLLRAVAARRSRPHPRPQDQPHRRTPAVELGRDRTRSQRTEFGSSTIKTRGDCHLLISLVILIWTTDWFGARFIYKLCQKVHS